MYLLLSALIKLPLQIHTTHLSHRLVSLAVRRVMLAGAISGGACRVWIFLDGWLGRLVPTILTCLIRNLKSKAKLWNSLQRSCPSIHHVTVGRPVVGVGVQPLDFKRSCIRLIGQLMDRDPLLIFSDNTDLRVEKVERSMTANESWQRRRCLEGNTQHIPFLNYLSLYQPAWDGCFAVVARFELQGNWAWADVGDGDVGRRPRHLYRKGKSERVNDRNSSAGKIKGFQTILFTLTPNATYKIYFLFCIYDKSHRTAQRAWHFLYRSLI